jgi:predicted nucleotidyltransferase
LLSVTGLAARTALTPQGVRKILDLLVGCGAVAMLGQAKTRLYGIGTHPIMESIVRLFEEEENAYSGAIKLLRECVGENEGVIAAWIYGSVARGEDRPNSDIDIAIVTLDTELERVTEEVRSAIDELVDRLPFPASIVSLGKSDIPARSKTTKWWESLLKEAIVLKGDRPDVLIRKITASNSQGTHR